MPMEFFDLYPSPDLYPAPDLFPGGNFIFVPGPVYVGVPSPRRYYLLRRGRSTRRFIK